MPRLQECQPQGAVFITFRAMKLSALADTLTNAEIVNIGNAVHEMIRSGEQLFNFTVGDFDPALFPIPEGLEQQITAAYQNRRTNYPEPKGNRELLEAIAAFYRSRQRLDYSPAEILVASGGRPIIYATFRTICDKGDKIIFPIPSWNNTHYVELVQGTPVPIPTHAAEHFMPSADQLRPHLKGAALIALCSPQNPTGTTFRKETLEAICDLVLEENRRRADNEKKLYVLYDQMYWQLTYGDIRHYDPVSLRPEMRAYTVYVDAISKMFAATGVRVGWALGPAAVINRMNTLLNHVGTWAPMAEQTAVARFLNDAASVTTYLAGFKKALQERLMKIYDALSALGKAGLPIEVLAPEAAIYLTVKIEAAGKTTASGQRLNTQREVTEYLLKQARVALVPFYAFGTSANDPWYRLSVGTCKPEDIPAMTESLRSALSSLK